MSATVHTKLHDFAAALLERRGALVDWPSAEQPGMALLPPEVAETIGAGAEAVPLAYEGAGEGLAVNLAGDFLEWAGRLLQAEPRIGTFRVDDLYLKRKDLDQAVAKMFSWPNAKVKFREGREASIEYHTWWFHGAMTSEDRWETCLPVSFNAATGAEVTIPDPLGLWELQPRRASASPPPATYEPAERAARRDLLQAAEPFLRRMDGRLQRDRRRLLDYYNALLRETGRKKTRGHQPADPEKIAAAKRAVDLELRRKLGELDERYVIEAVLTPVILIRTEVPVLAVDLTVFRKQAKRTHTVYWNPLVKQFDPMVCRRCGEGVFTVTFTNEEVEPLCSKCSASAGK